MTDKASKILENHMYACNCVRSITDRIRHTDKKLLQLPPEDRELVEKYTRILNKEHADLEKAVENRVIARQAVDELFNSMRG